jgi:uncharacterized protein with PIN domain
VTAEFRFYGPLNDFLPASIRHATLVCAFRSRASVKDLIESLGVPHPEVDRLVVNGDPVDFAYVVRDGDRVAAYPPFRSVDLGNVGRVGPGPQAQPRFVADVHLGRVAAYLRLAGFDTRYRNDCDDRELVAIACTEDRTLLTRDVGALKHGRLERGYFLREADPGRQFVEVLRRFDLVALAAPFTRCLRCNTALQAVPREKVDHLLQPGTRERHDRFFQCTQCGRVYWEGSHYSRMDAFLRGAFAAADSSRASPRESAI